jgi:hypothetical protein
MQFRGIFIKLEFITNMNMRYRKLLLASIFFLGFGATQAQDNGFEDFIRGGTDDANILFNHYMTPFMKGIGYGFNNGWYNTAKPHETLGFDLTISFNAAMVPVEDQTFEFIASEYSNTRIASGSTTLPTLMGVNTTTVLENYINSNDIPQPNPYPPNTDIPIGEYPAPDGIGDDIKPYSLNQIAVPSPIVQVGVGIIKGTEIKVRWLPTITNEDFNFKYFGIGGLHSISQWIKPLKESPLDLSVFVGYTTISAEYNIPAGNIEGDNQQTTFDVNTLTYQVLASVKLSVFTAYAGLGMDNFTTKFALKGTYDPYPGSPIPSFVDPINIEQSGNSSFRTTLGARLKLAILTLHADYTFREYNTLTAGIGFSMR